jgi:hypothetical protein
MYAISRFVVVCSLTIQLNFFGNQPCLGQKYAGGAIPQPSDTRALVPSEQDSWEGIYSATIGDDSLYEFSLSRFNGLSFTK